MSDETTTETPATTTANVGQLLATRGQAARRLNVSLSTIRRMEGAELDPIVIDGKHFFALEDIDRLSRARATDGQTASRAFALFNADKSVVDVVIALEQPPEQIERLHETWRRLTNSITVRGGNWGTVEALFPGLKPLTWHTLRNCLYIVHESPENLAKLRESLNPETLPKLWQARLGTDTAE